MLTLVAFAATCSAVGPLDVQPFLNVGETLVGYTGITYLGHTDVVFRGSQGSLFVVDNATGTVLDPRQSITALSQAGFSLDAADLQALDQLTANYSASVDACSNVYADFATGANGNCYDDTTYKFQCGPQLWGQGLWNGLLPFDITITKASILDGLSRMKRDAQAVTLASQEISAGNYSGAYTAEQSATDAQAAYAEFAPAHQQMLSYPPFATDGGLTKCNILSGLPAQISSLLAYASLQDPSAQQLVEGQINQTLQRGIASYFSFYASQQLQQYLAASQNLSDQFPSVDGARAFFILDDANSMRLLADSDVNTDTYPAAQGEFLSIYANATGRLESAQQSFASYANASREVSTMDQAAKSNSPRLDPNTDLQVSQEVSGIDTQFITLEQDLRIRASVTPQVFDAIAENASAENTRINVLANSPQPLPTPTLQFFGTTLQLPLTWLAGVAVLILILAGYVYYRRFSL